ncbi:MAG: hypothetical protein Kow0068_19270 [Marinilabiliales bacterium]
MILALLEFYYITIKSRSNPQVFFSISISVTFYILNFLYAIDYIHIKVLLLSIPLMLLIFISEIYRYKKHPINNVGTTLLSIIYIGVPLSLIHYFVFNLNINTKDIFQFPASQVDQIDNITDYMTFMSNNNEVKYSPNILMGYFIILWTFDSFAYLIGSLIGRFSLSKRISAKKSWEGLIGGAIVTFIVAFFISKYIKDLYLTNWLIIAFLVVFMSTFGDLVESLFKRSVSIKDSGKILPGHGGILDRFDGVLLSLPMVLFYLEIVKFN